MTVQQPVSTQPTTALVTGATSGLGREIAERLARDGMDVIVVGRDAARGAAVVKEIEEAGGRARFIAADLSDPAEIRRLAEEVGEIDVLVNNAGQSVLGPTESITAQDFDSIFATNVRAPFMLVGAFAPPMAARGAGSIVNISAMAGRIGMPGGAAYGATKAALASLTQGWTAEYSPRGVRVNAVAAGPIHTRPEARQRSDKLGDTTALHRASEPSEIAEVVAFLASPRASYVTGAIVAADGGRTAI
jgi:NAD(P)-dependent dehydrogenase (short-subunit alcohol dehydrogenase family)